MADRLTTVPLSDIRPAPDNLRKKLTDIPELAGSIAFIGLLEPIRVRKVDDIWEIVAGHRRYAAMNLLVEQGHEDWPADVDVKVVTGNKIDDAQRNAAMIIENLQRVDLDVAEEREGVRRLVQEYGLKEAEVATQLGVSTGWVKDRVALLALPDESIAAIGDSDVRLGDMVKLAKLPEKDRTRLLKKSPTPSMWDIDSAATKHRDKTKTERLRKKLVKAGHMVATDGEVKKLMATPVEECDGLDSVIKAKLGAAEEILHNSWDPVTVVSLRLKQIFSPESAKFKKSDLIVITAGTRWHIAETVKPGKDSGDGGGNINDVYDEINEHNRQLREQHDADVTEAVRDFIMTAKPAVLTKLVLETAIADMRSRGYNIRRMAKVLGIEVAEADSNDYPAYSAASNEAFDKIVEYAVKNSAQLARGAASAVLSDRRELSDVEGLDLPKEPKYRDYPHDDDDADEGVDAA